MITVEENQTVLDDTADKFGLEVVRDFSFCTFVILEDDKKTQDLYLFESKFWRNQLAKILVIIVTIMSLN